MNKAYIISDTHLGHDKIIEYCQRPPDHETRILTELKNHDTGDAVLIHLGDVCMGNDELWNLRIAEAWRGRRILVQGNHDNKSWSWYMSHGWDFVCNSFKLHYCGKIVLFSHKPQPWDGDWDLNIFGHLHNLPALSHHQRDYKELQAWHRLYAPELYNYRPVELTRFIQTVEKGQNHVHKNQQ